MCGIAGHVGPGADARLVQQMCEAIRHRGPDEDGYLREPDAVLGMRRLSIIDVNHGHQPVCNEDSTVAVVFNGEIYNFQELRSGLMARGHRFRTGSDGEVIAHLYEEQGSDLVRALRGMFAFALWDKNRSRLVLARDRAGKKPLFYRERDGGLLFGSELKSLLRDPTIERTIDPVSLDDYLAFGYVGAPRSIIAGVHKVPPAHVLIHEQGRICLERYWQLDYATKTTDSEAEATERVRSLIRDATSVRLLSERPLGAFLSGGIDSSLVVAAMAERTTGPVKTFCIGFDDGAFDERTYARIVADRFGTDHHELVVQPEPADLEKLGQYYDEPFADSSALPTFYVSEFARSELTVVLTGDGGDESFGGYLRYAANAAASRVPSMSFLQKPLLRLTDGSRALQRRPVLARRARHLISLTSGTPFDRYAAMMTYFNRSDRNALYTPGAAEQVGGRLPAQALADAWRQSQGLDLVDRMLHLDLQTYLPGDLLVKVDIATMAHSLEARSPLLDQQLMEYAATLPSSWKVRGRTTKYLLKQVARGWLPDEILARPKMGFGVPVASWLRTGWREIAWDTLTDQTARERGLFEPSVVRAMLTEHDGGRDWSTRIWSLLQFELWCRRWLDEVVGTAASSGGIARAT